MKAIYSCPDVKNEEGLWIRSYTTLDAEGEKVSNRTRSGCLWQEIQKRCSPAHWLRHPSYTGCKNKFKSFQDFAQWCQGQYGYLSKEQNGYFWSIDKDMLIPGNKDYSSDACMFVPGWINSLTTDNAKGRGDFPLGVSWHTGRCIFNSYINLEKGLVALGRYTSAEMAHKAWQKAKCEYLFRLCEEDLDLKGHDVAREAIRAMADRIYQDWLSDRETKSVIAA